MKKMTFGKGKQFSRRKFIVGSAAVAGGGLALGLSVPFARAQNGAANEVNVWVAILVFLAPCVYLWLRDIYLGQRPENTRIIFLLAVLAFWAIRPRIRSLASSST